MIADIESQAQTDAQYFFLDQRKKYVFLMTAKSGYCLPEGKAQLDDIKANFFDALSQVGFGANQIAVVFVDGIEVSSIIEVSENDS